MRVRPRGGANSAPPSLSAGFEGILRGFKYTKMRVRPRGGANSAPPNLSAGFEGILRGGKKRGKGKKGRGQETEGKRWKVRKKRKHPPK